MVKQKKPEAVQLPVTQREEPKKYRYYCDSCTGVAFIYTEGEHKPMMARCGKCGRGNEFKEANLIRL